MSGKEKSTIIVNVVFPLDKYGTKIIKHRIFTNKHIVKQLDDYFGRNLEDDVHFGSNMILTHKGIVIKKTDTADKLGIINGCYIHIKQGWIIYIRMETLKMKGKKYKIGSEIYIRVGNAPYQHRKKQKSKTSKTPKTSTKPSHSPAGAISKVRKNK
jgi:hypothetical protein